PAPGAALRRDAPGCGHLRRRRSRPRTRSGTFGMVGGAARHRRGTARGPARRLRRARCRDTARLRRSRQTFLLTDVDAFRNRGDLVPRLHPAPAPPREKGDGEGRSPSRCAERWIPGRRDRGGDHFLLREPPRWLRELRRELRLRELLPRLRGTLAP